MQDLTAIIVQTIATGGLVAAAVLPLTLKAMRDSKRDSAAALAQSKETKEAVTNSHAEHLRDQMDRQHRELTDTLGEVRSEMREDLSGVRRDIGRISDLSIANATHLGDLDRSFAEHLTHHAIQGAKQ